jgi:multiple sugar transport system permease protein
MNKAQTVRTTNKFMTSLMKYIILGLGCIVMLVPMIWMISTAFKPLDQVFAIPIQWIPREFHFENFTLPFQQRPFFRYFINSGIVAVVVTFTNLFFSSLAAFGLAKYNFPGRKIIFILILSVMMLPIEVRVVPLFLLVRALGLVDTYLGLIVPASITAFGVFIMHQFLVTLPTEYIEAGRIDGLSEFGIFLKIVLPLSKPALSALTIFVFLDSWNDYFWPLVATSTDSIRTLPLGLALFENIYFTQYNQVMAVSLLVTLPVLIVFLIMQKRFIEGMVMSGIKG